MYLMDSVNVLAKFEVPSFTRSWDNSDWSCGCGSTANPQSWGREGRTGSGMVPFERSLVSSYGPSIVTFPLYLRVSEILPLLCSSTAPFPTPPAVYPKFPHVFLGIGGYSLWAAKSDGVRLMVRAISFQDFQPGGLHKTTFSARLRFGRSRDRRSLILVLIESAYATSY